MPQPAAMQGRDYPLGQSSLRPCIMSDTLTDTQQSHLAGGWDRWTGAKCAYIRIHIHTHTRSSRTMPKA